MIDFLNDGASAAGKSLRDGACSFPGSALVPYHPVLEEGGEARDIIRFFGPKELRACIECLAVGLAKQIQAGLAKQVRDANDDDDDDRRAW